MQEFRIGSLQYNWSSVGMRAQDSPNKSHFRYTDTIVLPRDALLKNLRYSTMFRRTE